MWWTKRRRAQSDSDFETWIEGGVCPTLNAFDNTGDSRATVLIFTAQRVGEPPRIYEDVTPALLSRMGTGGNNTPMIVFSHTQGLDAQPSEVASPTLRSNGGGMAVAYNFDEFNFTGGEEVHHSIRSGTRQSTGVVVYPDPAGSGIVDNDGITVVAPIQDGRDIDKHQNGLGVGGVGDPMYTLDTTGGQAVAIGHDPIVFTQNQRDEVRDLNGVAGGLQASQGSHQTNYVATQDGSDQAVRTTVVRRLTPVECERLMGWPDNHTLYRADGKTNSDSTRYKMCGNGVATPVAQWIAEQIKPLLEEN